MIIRKAQIQDIPRIGDLLVQVCNVHHAGRPDLFREDARKYNDSELEVLLADPEKPIFVAVNEFDFVLGYCFCIFQQHLGAGALTDVKTLYIDDLCVDEDCRGMHIGSALYEHAKAFAKESGCYNLTLNVWAKNESAMRFYQKIGMQVQKVGMEVLL